MHSIFVLPASSLSSGAPQRTTSFLIQNICFIVLHTAYKQPPHPYIRRQHYLPSDSGKFSFSVHFNDRLQPILHKHLNRCMLIHRARVEGTNRHSDTTAVDSCACSEVHYAKPSHHMRNISYRIQTLNCCHESCGHYR